MERGLVVVSGASRGLGRVTAALLAEAGYTVVAGVLSAAEAAGWTDARTIPVPLDLTRAADLAALPARLDAEGRHLKLVALVNVAGLAQFDAVEHIDAAVLRRMFDVNVFGTLELTRTLLPRLKRDRGRALFVTSMAARASAPLLGAYSATKSAMESLVDALRVEMRPFGVQVALVEPGGIQTPMTDEALVHLRRMAERSRADGDDGAPYVPAYEAIAGAVESGIKGYLPPAKVGAKIVELVGMARVPTRTVIGLDAKAIVLMRQLLSDRLLDLAFAKQFKLATR